MTDQPQPETFTAERLRSWVNEYAPGDLCPECASVSDAEGYDTLCPRELARDYLADSERQAVDQAQEIAVLRERLNAQTSDGADWRNGWVEIQRENQALRAQVEMLTSKLTGEEVAIENLRAAVVRDEQQRSVLVEQVETLTRDINRYAYERDVARKERETAEAERDQARQEVARLREIAAGLAITGVTAGANPQKDGSMSPPLWHMQCAFCHTRWSKTTWKYQDAAVHPASGKCLLAAAPVESVTGEWS